MVLGSARCDRRRRRSNSRRRRRSCHRYDHGLLFPGEPDFALDDLRGRRTAARTVYAQHDGLDVAVLPQAAQLAGKLRAAHIAVLALAIDDFALGINDGYAPADLPRFCFIGRRPAFRGRRRAGIAGTLGIIDERDLLERLPGAFTAGLVLSSSMSWSR